MLRKVRVECPRCHLVCQLHLATDAPMVVIRCPSCATSLMTCGGRAVVLSETEMEAIRRGDGNSLMIRHMQKHFLGGTAKPAQPQPVVHHAPPAVARLGADERGQREITHDDVVDVYCSLETCADSAEFIAQLG